jgi:activator of 2-hydroxyglutaryl-CoA dehydratase
MVSLLAKGVRKENVIRGLHHGVARRVAGLMGRGPLAPEIYLDGGPANNPGLVKALEEEILAKVNVVALPQFTVAYGATLGI